MRRSLALNLLLVVGCLLLVDLLLVNTWIGAFAEMVREWIVLLAAAAAVAGVIALAARHLADLRAGRGDRIGSVVLLLGMGGMLVAGLRPGAAGTTDPAVQWLTGALLVPLAASVVALVFVFLLSAIRRSARAGGRETAVMLGATAAVVILMLPIGGRPGEVLADAARWTLAVPIGAVFRGLLIGVAVVGAVSALRVLLASDADD
ncbi:MAG TPA: hypothetical protein VJA85_07825 [Candidatus Limnocylindria bacterium]|nr:hypothetical protein [Candidatus Limnocylindria bacterium]